ncbi:MAG: ACT domain-containing protein, partial [Actinobacteria bacterium]|nr:ACT domain-containing protein [Actinomycetota bacterium]
RSDPGTVQLVAERAQTLERLELLWALTEADSLATGPSAWGSWKAGLVSELVRRTAAVIRGGGAGHVSLETFPTAEQKQRLAAKDFGIESAGDRVTVYAQDRPGTFSRTAGVLSLHGLDVLSAQAYSSDDGVALAEFRVSDRRRDPIPWEKVTRNLQLALDGVLALEARVAQRARTYGRSKPMRRDPIAISVRFDNDVSETATVVEVHAPNGIGILYRITHALADLDLDIRFAKVQTMGDEVVDSFYLRGRQGGKITDRFHLGEIEKAILHRLVE